MHSPLGIHVRETVNHQLAVSGWIIKPLAPEAVPDFRLREVEGFVELLRLLLSDEAGPSPIVVFQREGQVVAGCFADVKELFRTIVVLCS